MRRTTRIAAAVVLSAALISWTAPSQASAGGTSRPGKGVASSASARDTRTIIITFDKAQSDPAAAAKAAAQSAAAQVAGATVTKVDPITDTQVAVTLSTTLDTTQQTALGSKIEQHSSVKTAQASGWFTATSTNDTYYSRLWNLNSSGTYGVDAEDAWSTSTGSGAVIGVIDTGITAHSDLTGSTTAIVGGNVVAGYDFISDSSSSGDRDGVDSDPTDEGDYCTQDNEASSWHGTHVSGIIAAIRNNSKGVVGVAPGAKVQPLRVLGQCGGDETDVIKAIRWGAGLSVSGISAVNSTPDDVLNLSLGRTATCSAALQSAINAAVAAGTVVVVAAGNDATALSTSSPANCDNVISVTATGYTGALADYSNYGTSSSPATIAAPGGSAADNAATSYIYSTLNSGTKTRSTEDYDYMAGTSMATPHVAAVAALLKAMNPSLTAAEVTSLITGSATALSTTCATVKCGAGIVNAKAAVAAEVSTAIGRVGTPVISGTKRVGTKLSATTGSDSSAITFRYAWLRSATASGTATAITGATASSYTPSAADLGKYLSVRVTATLGGSTVTHTSAATSAIGVGTFSNTVRPVVKGTAKVGKTLSATVGSWSPTASTVRYRWLRNGVSITGATTAKHKLVKADRGKKISVRVTVSRTAYTTAAATSASRKIS